jgi:hypothetical protein
MFACTESIPALVIDTASLIAAISLSVLIDLIFQISLDMFTAFPLKFSNRSVCSGLLCDRSTPIFSHLLVILDNISFHSKAKTGISGGFSVFERA